jgi:glycosyltransferase involved in cell wall biosynthesis
MASPPLKPAAEPIIVAGGTLTYSDGGGKPAYVYRLLQGLASKVTDRPIHLILPENTRLQPLPPQIIVTSIPRRFPRSRPLISEMADNLALGTYAARHHPKAIFVTPADFWAHRHPPRTLAVIHDALSEVDPVSAGSSLRKFYRSLCLRYARNARLWVTISDFAADELAHGARGKRPRALSNWVDRKYRTPVSPAAIEALRQKFNLPARFILYVGGYSHYKNVEQLIRAHAEASRRTSLPPLVLTGRIPSADQPFRICDVHGEIRRSQCAENSIITPGFVDENDMPALYAAATLFVSPSLHEGFGYPPVEAMAVGCPVLVADRSSFREIVPDARSRFDPDSQEQFVTRLIEATQHPERFRCPFPEKYTEEAGIARYLDAIRSIDH